MECKKQCEAQHVCVPLCVFPRSLGGVHGIPKVHYKGRQGDYYIMVGLLGVLMST